MKFNRSRELKLFNATWDRIIHSSARPGELQSIKLCGPRGSGKTFFVQELARTQRGVYYMSFAGMSAEEALRKSSVFVKSGRAFLAKKNSVFRFRFLQLLISAKTCPGAGRISCGSMH